MFANTSPTSAFEVTSKRRKSYPSEAWVKTGSPIVDDGDLELIERLGRNDPPAPAVHGGGFKNCCLQSGLYDGIARETANRRSLIIR